MAVRVLYCSDESRIKDAIKAVQSHASNSTSFLILPRSCADNTIKEQRVLVHVSILKELTDKLISCQLKLSEEFDSKEHGKITVISGIEDIFFELVECLHPASEDTIASVYLAWKQSKSKVELSHSLIKPRQDTPPLLESTKTSNPLSPLSYKSPKYALEGVRVPDVRSSIWHEGRYHPIQANTRRPVEFNTDLFEGKVLFIVNHPGLPVEKDYRKKFDEEILLFEVQVQGKFKTKPEGTMFVGAEITKKMELGMLTRGVCGSILQLGRSAIPSLHHSFGDKHNVELPHITGPFWSTVDRLIVTAPDEEPPPMFARYVEPDPERKARKANPAYAPPLDLDNTYSFSLKTSKLDIVTWSTTNIPMLRPMDLHTFWSDADIRLVAYSVPDDSTDIVYSNTGAAKTHPQQELDYIFSLEIQHSSNHPEWNSSEDSLHIPPSESVQASSPLSAAEGSSTNEVDLPLSGKGLHRINSSKTSKTYSLNPYKSPSSLQPTLVPEAGSRKGMRLSSNSNQLDGSDAGHEDESYHDDDATSDGAESSDMEFFDAEEGLDSPLDTRPRPAAVRLEQVSGSSAKEKETHALSQYRRRGDAFISTTGFVVATVEVDDLRSGKKRNRRTMYAFLLEPQSGVQGRNVPTGAQRGKGKKVTVMVGVLRSFKEWTEVLPLRKLDRKPEFYGRLSDTEKKRLQLNHSYQIALTSSAGNDKKIQNALSEFLSPAEDLFAEKFLCADPCLENGKKGNGNLFGGKKLRGLPPLTLASPAIVKLGNHCWSQEVLALSEQDFIIVKHGGFGSFNSSTRVRLSRKEVLWALPVDPCEASLVFPALFSFVVATFARQYEVMVRGEELRNQWVKLLQVQAQLSPTPSVLPALKVEVGLEQSEETTRDSYHFGTTVSQDQDQEGFLRKSSSFSSVTPSVRGNSLNSGHNLMDLIAYPKNWKIGDKMVLNARSFVKFGSHYLVRSGARGLLRYLDRPDLLVEVLLEWAFQLCEATREEEGLIQISSTLGINEQATESGEVQLEVQDLWLSFMDGVALLQAIDLQQLPNNLSNDEALCLFLNLYHCMLLHSFLVIGTPTSLFKFQSLFRNCSYEAFGDIFSLAELEHCIIRAGMSRPDINVLAQFFIPSSQFSFALKNTRDYRLLWALNCGSVTNSPETPIFKPNKLHSQLDLAVRMNVTRQVLITTSSGSYLITLPQICQWYTKDFLTEKRVKNVSISNNGQNYGIDWVLCVLVQYLSEDQQIILNEILQGLKSYSVKYKSFELNCRFLRKSDESSPDVVYV